MMKDRFYDFVVMAFMLIVVLGAAIGGAYFAPAQAATPATVEVVCGEPADAGVWMLTRCEGDWGENHNVSVACKFE